MAEEKVWHASLHLEGATTEWYYALERDHGVLSWARFAEYVHMRFEPPIQSNDMTELKGVGLDWGPGWPLPTVHVSSVSQQKNWP
jgi:hypothetical protein